MKQSLAVLLEWLDGKKTLLLSIGTLVVGYLIKIHTIDVDLGFLLQGILSLLAGGAKLATNDMQGSNRLGLRKEW